MAATNSQRKRLTAQTFNGATVPAISAKSQLIRMVLANLLWEDQYYIDGQATADLIRNTVNKVSPEFVAKLALAARTEFKLRHVPLLLLRELARSGKLKAEQLTDAIQRPDEMGEFLSIYWKDKKQPLSNQVKKGLAGCFSKFSEYQLAKWDKNSANISVRDVMFLSHPVPKTPEQEALFKRIANQQLQTPDTWETRLSSGEDKQQAFSELMAQNKLGALAFLRNLRNMQESGISDIEIRAYGNKVNVDRVLPFRYVAASKHVTVGLHSMLEDMMFRSLASMPKLPGRTALLVDVSGSMFGTLVSSKSELSRFEAAASLAVLAKEVCQDVKVFSFSDFCVKIPDNCRGFNLQKALNTSQPHNNTYTQLALEQVFGSGRYDRVIIFTDEQSSQSIMNPPHGTKGYIVNVAAYQNGLNNGAWTTITGFSEATLEFIRANEFSSLYNM